MTRKLISTMVYLKLKWLIYSMAFNDKERAKVAWSFMLTTTKRMNDAAEQNHFETYYVYLSIWCKLARLWLKLGEQEDK